MRDHLFEAIIAKFLFFLLFHVLADGMQFVRDLEAWETSRYSSAAHGYEGLYCRDGLYTIIAIPAATRRMLKDTLGHTTAA